VDNLLTASRHRRRVVLSRWIRLKPDLSKVHLEEGEGREHRLPASRPFHLCMMYYPFFGSSGVGLPGVRYQQADRVAARADHRWAKRGGASS
jgi:hypothetical protein